MIDLAGRGVPHNTERPLGDVLDVNKGTNRMATAVKLQLLSRQTEQNRTRDNAIQLLAGAKYIGGTRKTYRKFVIFKKY